MEIDGDPKQMFCEVFTRLRETEAQTREQCVQIKSLCERIDNFTTVTDRFFELEDKRHQEDGERIRELFKKESERDARAEKREQNFWKIIAVLVGAVIVLAVGPKVAKDIFATVAGSSGTHHYMTCDIWHGDNDRRPWLMIPNKNRWPLV